MEMLITNKVYYKIFDLSFKESSHIYSKKSNDPGYLAIAQNNRNSIIDYYHAENRLLTEFASSREFAGDTELKGAYGSSSEDLSLGSLRQLPSRVELSKKSNIVLLQQVHGTKIIDADLIQDFTIDLKGDGLVTNKTNLILAIQTADCVPILLASMDGRLIGAAHCGWRGAKEGIVNNLVKLMKDKGAKNFCAVIGPSIQQYSYEVNEEFYNNFLEDRASYAKFFIPSLQQKHYMFDLPAYVKLQLQEAGVEGINHILEDTYTTRLTEQVHNSAVNPSSKSYKYPSYRRSFHTKELYNSSILSSIIIINS